MTPELHALRMARLRRAVLLFQGWVEMQGYRSDGDFTLHRYLEGKHQDSCAWCRVTEAMAELELGDDA